MKIRMKRGENAILFEDTDDHGTVIGAIGFQVVDGRFTIYIRGYEVDSAEFPALAGYHGYALTDNEMDEFAKFLDSLKPRRP